MSNLLGLFNVEVGTFLKQLYGLPGNGVDLGIVAIEEGAFGLPSTKVANFTLHMVSINCSYLILIISEKYVWPIDETQTRTKIPR